MSAMIAKAACLSLATFLLFGNCISGFILPEEVGSFANVILTNLPIIKIGTDSRIGIGFRLGEHVDFQVLTEYGPQKRTQPVGNNKDIKNKRDAMMAAALKGDFGPWSQAIAKFQMQRKYKKLLKAYELRSKNPPTGNINNLTKNNNTKIKQNS